MPLDRSFPKAGRLIRLRSWRDDYLYRPDSEPGLIGRYGERGVGASKHDSSWPEGVRDLWLVHEGGDTDHIKLQSWKGDYLSVDPDRDRKDGNLTTSGEGQSPETNWEVLKQPDGRFELRSSIGPFFLHRPDLYGDNDYAVVTFHVPTADGNDWKIEDVGEPPPLTSKPIPADSLTDGKLVRLRWMHSGAHLGRHAFETGVTMESAILPDFPEVLTQLWYVEGATPSSHDVTMRSFRGDYLAVDPEAGDPKELRQVTTVPTESNWQGLIERDGGFEVRTAGEPYGYLRELDGPGGISEVVVDRSPPSGHWQIEDAGRRGPEQRHISWLTFLQNPYE